MALEEAPSRIDRLLQGVAYYSWMVLCLLAFVSLPFRVVDSRSWWLWPFGIACFVCLVRLARGIPQAWLSSIGAMLLHPWLPWIALGVGFALRIVYVWIVVPIQTSDAGEYISLSDRLLATGEYVSYGHAGSRWYAFRAPGYAFFLAGLTWLIGKGTYTPAVGNLLCYVVTSVLLLRLGTRLVNRSAGVLAVVLFAVWPCHIGSTGVAGYELVLTVLTLASAWWILRGDEGSTRSRLWNAAAAGIANGLTIMVRPTAAISPAFWILHQVRGGTIRAAGVVTVVVATLLSAVVVAPWTIRNYGRGIPVLVSGTGSMALQLAANEYVGFDYDERAMEELLEKTGNRETVFYAAASQEARAWIRANFWRYLRQNAERMMNFLGEDSTGFYWSLSVGHKYKGKWYAVLQGIGHLWWSGLWVLCFMGAVRNRRLLDSSVGLRFMIWMVLAYTLISFPFFNVARYHIPIVPMMLVMGGLLVAEEKPAVEERGRAARSSVATM